VRKGRGRSQELTTGKRIVHFAADRRDWLERFARWREEEFQDHSSPSSRRFDPVAREEKIPAGRGATPSLFLAFHFISIDGKVGEGEEMAREGETGPLTLLSAVHCETTFVWEKGRGKRDRMIGWPAKTFDLLICMEREGREISGGGGQRSHCCSNRHQKGRLCDLQ